MDGDFVVVQAQCFFEVIDVELGSVTYTEIADDQAEDDVPDVMPKEARGVRTPAITVAGKMLDEADLGEASGLREPVNASTNLEVHEAASFKSIEVVAFHDFVGEHFQADADVFITGWWQVRSKIEVGNVQSTPFLVAGYDGVVDKHLTVSNEAVRTETS